MAEEEETMGEFPFVQLLFISIAPLCSMVQLLLQFAMNQSLEFLVDCHLDA